MTTKHSPSDARDNLSVIYTVSFIRKHTYPFPVPPGAAPDTIETWEVKKEETFMRGGERYYHMTSGHGEWQDLPVESQA